jgi:hypothetical protein
VKNCNDSECKKSSIERIMQNYSIEVGWSYEIFQHKTLQELGLKIVGVAENAL